MNCPATHLGNVRSPNPHLLHPVLLASPSHSRLSIIQGLGLSRKETDPGPAL